MISPKDKFHGEALRKLRLLHDLKQSVLANMLGLKNQQTYSRLEKGQKHFTQQIIELICSVFEINMSEFADLSTILVEKRPFDGDANHLKKSQLLELLGSYEIQLSDYNKLVNLILVKMLLEKEIESNRLKIESILSKKYFYFDGSKHFIMEFYRKSK